MKINRKKYLLSYTFWFMLFVTASYLLLFVNGKTLIWNNDCLSTHFEAVPFRANVIKTIIDTLVNEHRLIIPFVNWNLTQDSNLSHNIAIELFDILLWFVPKQYYELAFVLVNLFRLWCAGLCFSIFSIYILRHTADEFETESINYVLLGSMLYISCGYAVIATVRQPYFIELFCFLPLMLWAVEKEFHGEKTILLSIIVFLNAICTIYFLYYITAITGCYVIFRFIFVRERFGAYIKSCLRIVALYLIGLALSAVIFLPLSLELFATSRMGESVYYGNWFSYGWANALRSISKFFVWQVGFVNSSEWGYYGISVVALYPILYLLLAKDKKRFHVALLCSIVLGINIPIVGKFFGASTVNHRWSFCLGLLVAFLVTYYMPQIVACNNQSVQKRLNIGAISLCFGSLLLLLYTKDKVYLYELLMITGMISLINIFWKKKISKGKASYILLMFAALIVCINACVMETSAFNNYFVNLGNAVGSLESYVDVASTVIEDDGFYRIDKDECIDEMSCNLPYWFNYNGVSSTGNFINPNSLEYYHMSKNTGLMKTTKVSDFDSRITAETLAMVKYFLCDKDERKIPHGFEFYADYNNTYSIYYNPHALPVGYTYENVISFDSYASLNVAQQDEVILKSVVLEDTVDGPFDLQSDRLSYDIVGVEGVAITEDGIELLEDGATIQLLVNVPQKSELYVELSELVNRSDLGCKIEVSAGEYMGTAFAASYKTEYTNRQKEFVVNLGDELEGETIISIMFSGTNQNVMIGGIHLYARSLSAFEADVEKLRSEGLQETIVQVNGICGEIATETDKWLCFSIPYRNGWTCYIDGEKSELVKANVMYMATKIPKGDHTVELRYFPPGMKMGILFSVIGVIGLTGYAVWIRKTKEQRD